MMILDQYWWLMIPGLLLGLYAQIRVSSTYNRFLRVPVTGGLTGARAARAVLDRAGLGNVPIHEIGGHLSDHYDPVKRALYLSSENFHGASVAAVGVAAHEAGHALQHQAAYAPLNIRLALVPVAQFASNAALWIGLLGFAMGLAKIAGIAVVVFGIIALFQIVTLPVEFDASRRAKEQLRRLGLIGGDDHSGVSQVLNAAALTYVAAMVQSLLTLLHFVLILRGNDRE
jgi:Zn-dependent membrane protease YugP